MYVCPDVLLCRKQQDFVTMETHYSFMPTFPIFGKTFPVLNCNVKFIILMKNSYIHEFQKHIFSVEDLVIKI